MPLTIYVIKTPDSISLPDFDHILTFLPENRVSRIRKFLHQKNAIHTLAGEMITRTWLSKITAISPKKIELLRDSYGKPAFVHSTELFFNIAHSGNWVVAAFDSYEVGIDIELMREIDLSIAKRFFCKEEYDSLLKKKPSERVPFFYDLWTLKESYIKAEGKGLSIPLNSFCFTFNNEEIQFKQFSGEKKNYHFKQYHIDPDYKCAVCSYSDDFPDPLKMITFKDLCSEFLTCCREI